MKKGFTLIELLAAVIILAILALIIIPMIYNIIDNTKKNVIISDGYALIKAADMYYSGTDEFEDIDEIVKVFCKGNKCFDEENNVLFNYKGNINYGFVDIYPDNKMAVCISDDSGVYGASKSKDDVKFKPFNNVSLCNGTNVENIDDGTSINPIINIEVIPIEETNVMAGRNIDTGSWYTSDVKVRINVDYHFALKIDPKIELDDIILNENTDYKIVEISNNHIVYELTITESNIHYLSFTMKDIKRENHTKRKTIKIDKIVPSISRINTNTTFSSAINPKTLFEYVIGVSGKFTCDQASLDINKTVSNCVFSVYDNYRENFLVDLTYTYNASCSKYCVSTGSCYDSCAKSRDRYKENCWPWGCAVEWAGTECEGGYVSCCTSYATTCSCPNGGTLSGSTCLIHK